MMSAERVAYFNGQILPESEVRLPFRDLGWMRAVAVYDTERTFGGAIFKLDEHLERLWRSLNYTRIPLPMPITELAAVTIDVARQNYEIVGEDIWVSQRISRGVPLEDGGYGEPNLVVECLPLPFARRAPYYRDGVKLITPTVRRTPPWAVSPQAKTHDLMNFWLADHEVHGLDPMAWPMLTDEQGCLAEGAGANVFMVRDGRLYTPPARFVLPGVTRNTVIELAHELGIPVEEAEIDLYTASTADELFITSTSLCVCPVASLNGAPVRHQTIPGPVTRGLQDAFRELIGVDFVGQFLSRLPAPAVAVS
jgi:branched-chain amino acid aminotransferase